ncbi:hypothetical protein DNTS_013676 [Danionella cerebrum]|uniref:NAD-dependent protein deacylase sirtuin-5, mitochondrial n=1 Tax=Danionella cerebrum TaxID=2873325 RepID=A0A553N4I6_9TELE|nr:hypothetical protein DNTS_013676 [Danionella translucida]
MFSLQPNTYALNRAYVGFHLLTSTCTYILATLHYRGQTLDLLDSEVEGNFMEESARTEPVIDKESGSWQPPRHSVKRLMTSLLFWETSMIVGQLWSRGLTSRVFASIRLTTSSPEMSRPSSDLAAFREQFARAQHIAVITGAGVSAESGVPTFRGQGGYWRKWQAQVMRSKLPNPAHMALADCEARLSQQGRSLVIITQNIDELHHGAGSKHVYELHGSLFKTRCMSCGEVKANHKSPICPALEGKGAPDPKAKDARIAVEHLPRCEKSSCNGLLRPHVVWFGETLDSDVLTAVERELEKCDLCLVVGTSSIVYPAAMFAPQVAARGVPVAEFNMENTPATHRFKYHFEGPCGRTLPPALERHESEAV